jgi:hypothetical protein
MIDQAGAARLEEVSTTAITGHSPTRVMFEMPDRDGVPAIIEITVRLDTVEVRCRGRLVGIPDRDQLSAWLRAPQGVLAYDEVAWFYLGEGIALAVDDVVSPSVLAGHVLTRLREAV